ncbi:3-isopropylmalate dehydrogenase [Buchananella hordeovulneris]|uniref:3-isopropylmalate dehydrogenase n=1 Tax=Buchananella hordeovulneris TaxID=52770 RepID=UPI001C9E35C3|nr:3-isopropylmalate dehydrogenase [Buchananella hordeovulneris]
MRVKLALIPGDGIGQEVVPVALTVLQAALGPDVAVQTTEFDLGARRYLATGQALTEADLAELATHDAILLGAIGDPAVASGVLERELLLRLRFAFDHAVNLRPSRTYPGAGSPLAAAPPIDLVVVREGTEGLYCGNGGVVRGGTDAEIATEVSVNTAYGVARVVRDAFARAAARRGQLTLVHKHNVLVHAGGLWQRLVDELAAEFPQVQTRYLHIDAAMIALVVDPGQFDVVVTDNLFGDIFTDLAAAVTGGIGLAASANINTAGTFPSMFEPVHGSAPDIAGRGVADPVAAILSAALLAAHLGQPTAAARIEAAVAAHLAARGSQPVHTEAVGRDIVARLGEA